MEKQSPKNMGSTTHHTPAVCKRHLDHHPFFYKRCVRHCRALKLCVTTRMFSTIRIPWPENMEMLLAVVDSQFIIHGIAQALTKFHDVVGVLTPGLADRLRHIICNPPSEKPCTSLREAIIKLTALSDRHRFITMMRDVELGDRCPP